MGTREHRRAQLQLPVRLRWSTPFGHRTELARSLDASRGGLLVACNAMHATGVTLWVTFPFHASLGDGQPEVPARVVRCACAQGKKLLVSTPAIALQFEALPRAVPSGNNHARTTERRASPRRALALPVRVRPENFPWFEEAMTRDVSSDGLCLLSNREYQPGNYLLLSFAPSAFAPWPGKKEFRSRIVRADPVPGGSSLALAVCRSR